MMDTYVRGGIWGAVIGDALGVPVEFCDRSELREKPVTGMRSGGTYGQPAGTWSDDSSLALCTLEALADGWDPDRMMDLFFRWANEAYMTAYDEVFDMGIATREALRRYQQGIPPSECGGVGEFSNGNGSLMRILPAAFYLRRKFGEAFPRLSEGYRLIHDVSRLTHGHPISLISCGIYCAVAGCLMQGKDLHSAVREGIEAAKGFYRNDPEFAPWLDRFLRVDAEVLAGAEEDDIQSDGFVLHSLEAALWCLLHTGSFSECLLRAVNLGSDTDTVAAVAGGLAGIFYGYDAIPREWVAVTAKGALVDGLCLRFSSEHRAS